MRYIIFFILLGGSLPAWTDEVPALTLLEQADQLFSAGQLEQAEIRYQEALVEEPNNQEAYMRMGGFYLSQHRTTDAIKQFQAVLGINPELARAFAALGIAYWHNHDYILAEAALQEALRLQPELLEAQKLLQALQQTAHPLD